MTLDDPHRLYDAYAALAQTLALPVLEPVRLVIARDTIDVFDREAVKSLIARQRAGWIAFRSGVEWFSPGRDLPVSADRLGPVLSAEFAGTGDGSRLWFDGVAGDGWRQLTLREVADGGDWYLAEDLMLLSDIHDQKCGGNLLYRRYWAAGEDGAIRPRYARFLGFGGVSDAG
ncbi:MAG: hypothetical protein RLO51_16380 [Thalassobaculum sp.]|uniref:hypothetical protein n=1 Tax=Thalassobaculum sp. TaxID=2022740 RepID=UPI0032EE607D